MNSTVKIDRFGVTTNVRTEVLFCILLFRHHQGTKLNRYKKLHLLDFQNRLYLIFKTLLVFWRGI